MKVFSSTVCMVTLATLAAATLVVMPLRAQQTVRVVGHAFDETLGMERGVESVQVVLVSAADSTVRVTARTDAHGRFLFEGLQPGRYQVRMARIGYSRMKWEREFRRADDTLSIGMQPANSADYLCSTNPVLEPGFLVRVRDQDAQPVTSGITIVARSAAEVDTLRRSDERYAAVPSREGTYVFEVTGAGIRPMQSDSFAVRTVTNRPGALCGIPIPALLFVERDDSRRKNPGSTP